MRNFYKQVKKDMFINKKSDTLICIPTFKSSAVTLKLLDNLMLQKRILFDILIVDMGGRDYVDILAAYPDINYFVSTENYASSGAQRIGMELALKYRYKYLIATDNDAELLNETGLNDLKELLERNPKVFATVPHNLEVAKLRKDEVITHGIPYHYIFIRVNMLKDISLPNPYYYLYSDDIAFTTKILSNYKMIASAKVPYYHPVFQEKGLSNVYYYFHLRGLIIMTFMERDLSLRFRIRHFSNICYKLFVGVARSTQCRNFVYIKTMFIAVKNAFKMGHPVDFSIVPVETFSYHRVERKPNINSYAPTLLNTLFLRSCYFHTSNYFNKTTYYIRKSRDDL